MKSFNEVWEEKKTIEERWFNEWRANGVKPSWNYHEKVNEIEKNWLLDLKVGDRAHVRLYSDVEPCTVIKRTAKTVTVRYDHAEMNGDWKPEVILGGFVGHCTNQYDQWKGWDITEDPNGSTETFYWSEKYGKWQGNGCTLRPEWKKFYDYNF